MAERHDDWLLTDMSMTLEDDSERFTIRESRTTYFEDEKQSAGNTYFDCASPRLTRIVAIILAIMFAAGVVYLQFGGLGDPTTIRKSIAESGPFVADLNGESSDYETVQLHHKTTPTARSIDEDDVSPTNDIDEEQILPRVTILFGDDKIVFDYADA